MIGTEHETRNDILNMAEELSSLPIHQLRLTIATPFPGTPWYKDLEKQGRITTKDWSLYDTNHLVWQHPAIGTEEMRELQLQFYKTFYLSNQWNKRIDERCKSHPEQAAGLNMFREYVTEEVRKLPV